MSFKPKHWLVASWLALSAVVLPMASAQDYPQRVVTIVVPFAPGGGVDVMGRLLAERLRTSLGQNVIVENRPGASGMLGAQAVVRAKPDGYTILLGSAGETAINEYVYKDKMGYRPSHDLAPVALVARVPNVLVAGESSKVRSVAELLEQAKANPGLLTYATSGVGNPQHLNGALLESITGASLLHVPYRGASAQLADVVGGAVDLTFVSYAAALPFIQSGKVRPLAVTSAERAPFAPDIPALAETDGLQSYALVNWFGVFAPAGTPDEVIGRLNTAVNQALQDPGLAKSLTEQGGEVTMLSVQEFADFIKNESVRYADIVETAQIVAE